MKIIAIVLLAVLSIKSCNINSIWKGKRGNGTLIVKELPIGDFSKIESSASADVVFEQSVDSASAYCRVEIDENLSAFLSVKEVDGTLRISATEKINPTVFKVYVKSYKLKDASLSGAGSIVLKGKVKSDELSISLQGPGDIKAGSIDCSVLKTELKGSGDIEIKELQCYFLKTKLIGSGDVVMKAGETRYSEVELTGSGDLDIAGIVSKNTACQLKGSGDICLRVTDSLRVELKGSGDIQYAGNPLYVDKNIKGSGDLKARK